VCAGNGGAFYNGEGDAVVGDSDVVKVVGDLKEMACGSGVDNCGGVERRVGSRLCGCNGTPSNFYISSSIHKSCRPSRSGSGSHAWVGQEVGGGTSHHVAGGGDELTTLSGIEAGCAGVADLLAKTVGPSVGARGLGGDDGHACCSADGGCNVG
jgi:hypothetical protein